MIPKHPVYPGRVRRVPPGFGWVDHRLVRERRIEGLSHASMALYLFLVTVSDGEGLSYWSRAAMCSVLAMDEGVFVKAGDELEEAGLVAHEPPIWQVLDLEGGRR